MICTHSCPSLAFTCHLASSLHVHLSSERVDSSHLPWSSLPSDSSPSCQHLSKIPSAGSLVGCGGQDTSQLAVAASLAPRWSRGDEVRSSWGRPFETKSGFLSSQAGEAFCCREPSCQLPQRRWAALARECVWPSPWESCASASQVRSAMRGAGGGGGVPTPTRVLQSLSV